MNKREKILAVVVVGVLVLVLGNAIVKTLFLAPISDKDRAIDLMKSKIEKTDRQLKTKNRMIQYWRSISKLSLDSDPGNAFLTLSARVTTIINSSGLRDVSVKPISISVKKGNGVELYYPIAVNLSARGTIDQIVKFLALVRNEPYIVKITGFTLRPEGREDLLAISNCRIESIVPAKPNLEKFTPVEDRPTITATQPAVKPSLDAQYAMLIKENVFTPKKQAPPPPKPVPTTTVQTPTTGNVQTSDRPVAQGPGRPGDVVGTFMVGQESGAYIRNQTDVGWYKVGERLANQMELKYVHPLGIVLRNGSDKIYYVEIGDNISQANPLNETANPELYQAYQAMISVH